MRTAEGHYIKKQNKQTNMEVPELDVDSLKANRNFLIVGKCGTGKTTLVRDLVFHLREKISFAVGCTAGEEDMREFIPIFGMWHCGERHV